MKYGLGFKHKDKLAGGDRRMFINVDHEFWKDLPSLKSAITTEEDVSYLARPVQLIQSNKASELVSSGSGICMSHKNAKSVKTDLTDWEVDKKISLVGFTEDIDFELMGIPDYLTTTIEGDHGTYRVVVRDDFGNMLVEDKLHVELAKQIDIFKLTAYQQSLLHFMTISAEEIAVMVKEKKYYLLEELYLNFSDRARHHQCKEANSLMEATKELNGIIRKRAWLSIIKDNRGNDLQIMLDRDLPLICKVLESILGKHKDNSGSQILKTSGIFM